MADKSTVTMFSPNGKSRIEVQPDTVEQMKNKGWTTVLVRPVKPKGKGADSES